MSISNELVRWRVWNREKVDGRYFVTLQSWDIDHTDESRYHYLVEVTFFTYYSNYFRKSLYIAKDFVTLFPKKV